MPPEAANNLHRSAHAKASAYPLLGSAAQHQCAGAAVHPLAIALSVLTGTILAGIPGALLSVPLVAFLNATVHALRGWPSPMGATVNISSGEIFDELGHCTEDSARFQLETVATQVVEFAALRKAGAVDLAALSAG